MPLHIIQPNHGYLYVITYNIYIKTANMKKVIKKEHYRDCDIEVVEVEEQQVETLFTGQTTEGQTAIAWAKEADHPKSGTVSYEAKNVTMETTIGDVHFGISITRSNR
jgi:hypothetical protein